MYVHAEPSAARLLACPAKKQRAEPPSKLIPAGAGNTTFFSSWSGLGAVHPRWRGEHLDAAACTSANAGSSPLARGTPHLMWPTIAHQRFIPAGAGNTSSHGLWWERRPVHPRWRGVHCSTCVYSCRPDGSSPLARGTLNVFAAEAGSRRFIPAGAGNTPKKDSVRYTKAVHPRWRGEHAMTLPRTVREFGSSPLARGTQPHSSPATLSGRFIPAGAGNTRAVAWFSPVPPVHPRWRGEHNGIASPADNKGGSSPLARGTRCWNG